MPMPDEKETLTFSIGEVAARLGVDKVTIGRWEDRGSVPPAKRLRRNGRKFYTAADLALLLEYRDAVVEPAEAKDWAARRPRK